MKFGNPSILWLALIAVPLLALFQWWAWRKRQLLISHFVGSRLLASLTVGVSKRRQILRMALIVLAVLCCFLALARPEWGVYWQKVEQRGLDILVAIDTSRSMLAADIPPNRIERAKLAALDLMQSAQDDRLGLIPFAGTAFLQCPLTFDADAFQQSIDALHVGIIPAPGTAIAQAIDTAIAAAKTQVGNFKILVLLSDGEDQAPGAIQAAKAAARIGMRIFTVGVGTPNGDLIRVPDGHGGMQFLKDRSGNAVKSRLNEALLKKIAALTHGFYLHLQGARTMEVLYRRGLAPLPKRELDSRIAEKRRERYQWPLGLAIVFLLIEMFLPVRKPPRPSIAVSSAVNPALKKALPLLLLAVAPLSSKALSPGSALDAYKKGHYEDALKQYEALIKRNPKDVRLQFNAGAAAYKAGDYAQAAKHYKAALESPQLELQEPSYYNVGNLFYQLGNHAAQPSRKIAAWKQSIKQYQNALQLNKTDPDARHNLDYVKKKLQALLKKQPPSSSKKKNNKKQQKHRPSRSNSPNQQKKKSSSPKSKPHSQHSPQNQSGQTNQNHAAQPPPSSPRQGNKNNAPRPKPKPGSQQQANRPRPSTRQKPKNQQGQTPPVASGQMTPQQARQLLNALKSEEKTMIFRPPQTNEAQQAPLNDW